MKRFSHLIDGRAETGAAPAWIDVIEPATGVPWTAVPAGTADDVDRAVDAAVRAFPEWASTPAEARSQLLLKLAAWIEERAEDFALAESNDNGKPLTLARRMDVSRAIANLRFFATRILHTVSELHVMDDTALNYTLRQPRGVVGCITPWNLPLLLFTWKVAPALATGNCVVAKPSELTPSTASMLGEGAIDVGFPPGVLNIVHGLGPTVGQRLVEHPLVTTISFTGGTATGRRIGTAAGGLLKKVALELGGKNPTIIFADAAHETSLTESLRAAFLNQGEICLCGSRIFVERARYESFVEEFVERTRHLRVGDPRDPLAEQGAIASAEHLAKVQSAIEDAAALGGEIRCGGGRPTGLPERCQGGYFLEPTVITGLDADCRTNQEEIFGPVVTILPFDDEDHVVAMANSTPYGLASSLWTNDLSRAHRVARRLETGTVWVNCWMLRDLRVPFGGMKQSGVGREGGEEAMRFFTEPRNVCIRTTL